MNQRICLYPVVQINYYLSKLRSFGDFFIKRNHICKNAEKLNMKDIMYSSLFLVIILFTSKFEKILPYDGQSWESSSDA